MMSLQFMKVMKELLLKILVKIKRYIIEYQDNDNDFVYKPTMQDFIKIME